MTDPASHLSPPHDALHQYQILDTPPEEHFDRLVRLATQLVDVPIALISFLDAEREWIKASVGIDRNEVPRSISFGAHTIAADDVVVVTDATSTDRFADNPLVESAPGVQFYAGIPLVPDEQAIGTLAILDTTPRTVSAVDLRQHLSPLRALAEEELLRRRKRRRKEKALNDLVDPSEKNTAVLDRDGTILQISDNWLSSTGDEGFRDPAEVNGNEDYLTALRSSPVAPETEYAQRAKRELSNVLQGQKSNFEMLYPGRASNEATWYHMQVLALDHPDVRALVIHTNVSPLEADPQRAGLLEAAVEETNEAIIITEGTPLEPPGPRITYVNPAFTDITGYESEEVIGKTPRLLQGPATEPWVLQSLREHLEQGQPFEGEAINYRKNGTPYVNHWSVAPVRNRNGTITHWVSVQRDVTEERRMGERLLEALEKERRNIARKMHDEIGGLLTSLQMCLDRLRLQVDSTDPGRELLNTLETQIDALSKVVRTLTGQFSSRVLKDYGLSEAARRLVETFEERNSLDVELHNEIEPGERLSPLIERVVYRVLREALNNVARHAQTERAEVILNKTHSRLRLHVIDHGRGFESSTELRNDDNHGLPGMMERVERLNGSLSINTSPGEGTRLSITLPLTLVSLPQ